MEMMLVEMGKRVQIDGEWWIEYDVPEWGCTTSIKCGSTVERLSPEKWAEANKVVLATEAVRGEASLGLLVHLGLAVPRAAGIKIVDEGESLPF